MPLQTWLATSLERVYPLSDARSCHSVELLLARGERLSFQACARVTGMQGPVELGCEAKAPEPLTLTVRRVGHVPVPHHNTETPADHLDGVGRIPGYVPDPLLGQDRFPAPANEAHSFWISVSVPHDAPPGRYCLQLCLWAGRERAEMEATVEVAPLTIQPRRDFAVTHWFYADALCDWYAVEPWSRPFWRICDPYVRGYVAHGFDTLLTPLFTPPTDGVKRPTQLLRVTRTDGGYAFDWSDVEKWIRLARRCGVERFEWPHLFTQWGVEHAIRIYHGQGLDERLLWAPRTGATSPIYRRFLGQLLPELHSFLKAHRLLDRSFFHVSDEPHGPEHLANYRKARALLAELAPWMKTMDALSEIEYGRQGITDMPIPSISITRQYKEEGIPCWTYFCCGPRGRFLNRLLDTPLGKVRMSGWLFHRFRALGFLHWGFNYWYKRQTRELIDPYTVSDGKGWPGWAYGDTFLVYPGEDGPLWSIRGEVFRESLQDLALLQTLGVDPEGELLASLRDFDDFPWSAAWIANARRRLLQGGRV